MMKHVSITRYRQRGVGLVAALFLVVVFGALGAFIVTIGGAQQQAPVLAVQGARAYNASRSGIDWGVYQVLNTALGAMCNLTPALPFVTPPFPVPGPGLNGFQVTVSCNYTQHQEGASTFEVFAIRSTATFGAFGGSDYFSRVVEATVTNAPP